MPESVQEDLKIHLNAREMIHRQDLEKGFQVPVSDVITTSSFFRTDRTVISLNCMDLISFVKKPAYIVFERKPPVLSAPAK